MGEGRQRSQKDHTGQQSQRDLPGWGTGAGIGRRVLGIDDDGGLIAALYLDVIAGPLHGKVEVAPAVGTGNAL